MGCCIVLLFMAKRPVSTPWYKHVWFGFPRKPFYKRNYPITDLLKKPVNPKPMINLTVYFDSHSDICAHLWETFNSLTMSHFQSKPNPKPNVRIYT